MAATLNFVESVSSVTDTVTMTNCNFGSTLSGNLSPSTYPISAGNYSVEKYIRAHFTGTFTSVSNLQFWKSAGTLVTGFVINCSGLVETHSTPTSSESSHATTAILTASGTENVGISGTLGASLTASGYSDYCVIQASVSTAASAGSVNQLTYSFAYDET